MTHFTVDARELLTMAADAYSLRGYLDEHALSRSGLGGVAGHHRVDHEYHAFVQHWSDGLAKMRDQLAGLGDRLEAAGASYIHTEHAIAARAGEGATALAGSKAAGGSAAASPAPGGGR